MRENGIKIAAGASGLGAFLSFSFMLGGSVLQAEKFFLVGCAFGMFFGLIIYLLGKDLEEGEKP